MKKVKMILYGVPGVGKSWFAADWPKPVFLTTDSNYEFLIDYKGLKSEDEYHLNSWEDCERAFNAEWKNYDTIVVDLFEDTWNMCKYKFCEERRIEYLGDLPMGKGWDLARNKYLMAIDKLLKRRDKNVLLLMHADAVVVKNKQGVENTRYEPSKMDKQVRDTVAGRMGMVLRCYTKTEKIDNEIIKKRLLKLMPDEEEFGVNRAEETKMPYEIELDFNSFSNIIGLEKEKNENEIKNELKKEVKEEVKEKEVFISPVVEKVEKIEEPVISAEEKNNQGEKELTPAEKKARILEQIAKLQSKK